MSNWSQPMCERCWIDAEGEFDLDVLPDGTAGQRLVQVRRPFVMVEPVLETCAWCGAPTIVGIYRRADPAIHDIYDCSRDGSRAVYGHWRRP